MDVLLCGYHWTGCRALELLREAGHNVFVFTHENPYHVPSLIDYCRKINESFSLENVSRVELPFIPDVICSIYYRYIIRPPVIRACGGKIFNLHPSLLPDYRGCSSLTWAMINGDKEAGFTYHYIDEGTDTGDIIIQEKLDIKEWDTQETLFMRAMFESIKLFPKAFDHVSQKLPGRRQVGEGSYHRRGCPYDGQIDPSWDPVSKERFIRAMIYPPYPVARVGDKEVHTLKEMSESL